MPFTPGLAGTGTADAAAANLFEGLFPAGHKSGITTIHIVNDGGGNLLVRIPELHGPSNAATIPANEAADFRVGTGGLKEVWVQGAAVNIRWWAAATTYGD